MRIGAIEAGGTKTNCGVGDENGNLFDYVSFPTRDPMETLHDVTAYFHNQKLDGLGVASFGPVEVSPLSPKYGKITSTPKLAWQNFDWFRSLEEYMNCPMFLDTDVNAAALGEARWGAASGLRNCVYVTVGTGIGAGLLVEGNLVHGLLHPEAGHMFVRRHALDTYQGHCPFHGDCLEGLAAGPALAERWGRKAETLDPAHLAWDIEAYYLAQAVVNLTLTSAPEKVILGGGVFHQPELLRRVRQQVIDLLNGYLLKDEIIKGIENFIVQPGLGDFAGLKGALALVVQ